MLSVFGVSGLGTRSQKLDQRKSRNALSKENRTESIYQLRNETAREVYLFGWCAWSYPDVQGLARDLAPRGITINNVQPGPVNTELNPEDGGFAAMLKKVNALPRYGTAEEIAGMVAYLAGPGAAYITGASLMIDGGFSA